MAQEMTSAVRIRMLGGAAAAAVLALVAGCAAGESPPTEGRSADTRVIETHYGEVTVPEDPQRIAAVSYNTVWQLQSLDVQPVAAQDYSRWAQEYTDEQNAFIDGLETVGSFGELNYEAIAAAEPDLIVGDAYEIDEEVYAQLSDIAPTAIYFGDNRGDWPTVVDGLAEATGAQDALSENRDAYEARIADLQQSYAEVISDQQWGLIAAGDGDAEFVVLFPTGEIGATLTDLGVSIPPGVPEPDEERAAVGYANYSFEYLDQYLGEADIILTPANADGSTWPPLDAVFSDSLFQALPAAQEGDVYEVYAGIRSYSDALEYLDRLEEDVLARVGE
ncbi:ABC transporter substrate-binding protein [Ruania halotolerans]|uniref:ABC transporter substrate-binding protein n=1 Tax=Ruania halotolerans TaxID=2897773 RepID=UPI001E503A7F|nr:ABC transporter substrate-binding protein [Ruania halotolerans]UFU05652.1 ABC transporter substrate-binding protein [Ruania halotolerans]